MYKRTFIYAKFGADLITSEDTARPSKVVNFFQFFEPRTRPAGLLRPMLIFADRPSLR